MMAAETIATSPRAYSPSAGAATVLEAFLGRDPA